jgi:hypothetical protein
VSEINESNETSGSFGKVIGRRFMNEMRRVKDDGSVIPLTEDLFFHSFQDCVASEEFDSEPKLFGNAVEEMRDEEEEDMDIGMEKPPFRFEHGTGQWSRHRVNPILEPWFERGTGNRGVEGMKTVGKMKKFALKKYNRNQKT